MSHPRQIALQLGLDILVHQEPVGPGAQGITVYRSSAKGASLPLFDDPGPPRRPTAAHVDDLQYQARLGRGASPQKSGSPNCGMRCPNPWARERSRLCGTREYLSDHSIRSDRLRRHFGLRPFDGSPDEVVGTRSIDGVHG
jgi:hypothetical protein